MPLDPFLTAVGLGRPQSEFVWREIHWPAELDPEVSLALLRQLATDRLVRLIAFEVEARGELLVHRVGVPEEAVGRVEQLVTALVPDGALTVATRRPEFNNAWRVALTTHHRPLQTSSPEQITRAVLAALTAAGRTRGSSCSGYSVAPARHTRLRSPRVRQRSSRGGAHSSAAAMGTWTPSAATRFRQSAATMLSLASAVSPLARQQRGALAVSPSASWPDSVSPKRLVPA